MYFILSFVYNIKNNYDINIEHFYIFKFFMNLSKFIDNFLRFYILSEISSM